MLPLLMHISFVVCDYTTYMVIWSQKGSLLSLFSFLQRSLLKPLQNYFFVCECVWAWRWLLFSIFIFLRFLSFLFLFPFPIWILFFQSRETLWLVTEILRCWESYWRRWRWKSNRRCGCWEADWRRPWDGSSADLFQFLRQTWHLDTFCLRSPALRVSGRGRTNWLFCSTVASQKLKVFP